MPIQALLDSVCCGLGELWEKLHADILFVVGYISEDGVSLADVDAAALNQVLDWFCFVHLEVILLLGQLGDIAWTCANGYGNLLEFVLDPSYSLPNPLFIQMVKLHHNEHGVADGKTI